MTSDRKLSLYSAKIGNSHKVASDLVLLNEGNIWRRTELTNHQGFLLFSDPDSKKIERLFVLGSAEKCCKQVYHRRRACLRVSNDEEQLLIR